MHPGDLIMRRIRILGSQQNGREYLCEALQIAASGKVKVMTEIYSLDQITKAYERVAVKRTESRATERALDWQDPQPLDKRYSVYRLTTFHI
ncbi:MAG TPA: hypothetical protein VFO40_25650 [Chthoniobacterales bacterium]|nr:hypothetical protein [Chthoniobacterales bacterium]